MDRTERLFTFMHWRRKWQPIPVFLTGEPQGGEPGGLPLMWLHRVRRDCCDLAAAAAAFFMVQRSHPQAYWRNHSFDCMNLCWQSNVSFNMLSRLVMGFPCGSAGKESACNIGDLGLIPGLRRFPQRRERIPTPVFWLGEVHGLYSPWGHRVGHD